MRDGNRGHRNYEGIYAGITRAPELHVHRRYTCTGITCAPELLHRNCLAGISSQASPGCPHQNAIQSYLSFVLSSNLVKIIARASCQSDILVCNCPAVRSISSFCRFGRVFGERVLGVCRFFNPLAGIVEEMNHDACHLVVPNLCLLLPTLQSSACMDPL